MIDVVAYLKERGIYVRQRFYDPGDQAVGGVYPRFLAEEKHPAVAKTLVCFSGRSPTCLLLSYGRRANLKALACAIGAPRFRLAKPEEVTDLTGYQIGAVSPVMPARHMLTIVDAELAKHPYLYVNGGRPGLQIRIGTPDLINTLGATVTKFAEPI